MEFAIAKRPDPTSTANFKKVSLLSNYYKFQFTNPKKNHIFKYSVKFTPEVPDNSRKVRNKIVNGVRKQIESHIGFFIFINNCIYSLDNDPEIPKFISEYEDVQYEVEINWAQCINDQDLDLM